MARLPDWTLPASSLATARGLLAQRLADGPERAAAVDSVMSTAFAALRDGTGELASGLAGAPPEVAGQLYEALLAPDTRRAGGSHFTPPDLAAEVVEHTLAPLLEAGDRRRELSVCDPAVGGGAFLLAAARWLADRCGEPLAQAAGRLHGVDIDPGAVAVARQSLALLAGDDAGLEQRLIVADALLDPLPWPAGHFDAVVGNPPFVGGSFLSGTLGADYRARLVRTLAGGRRGNADLCAFFFLRAQQLLRPGGRCGLVATNTIAEGDTRRVGLELLLARGAQIDRAERRRPWPGEASAHVSLVWFAQDGDQRECVLDGRPVAAIGAGLSAPLPTPHVLPANRGVAFHGSKTYGQGFLLTDAEAGDLLAAEPQSAAVVKRYLSGDDLYGRPDQSPSRWVIDFREWPLARAEEHPLALARVRALVKPERDRLLGRNTIGTARATRWWQFGSPAPGLYAAVAPYQRVLAKVLHSHTHAVCFVESRWIFSHALAVFASDDPALLAILQSGWHAAWAHAHGSTLGAAPRYTPGRIFETFPLPPSTPALAELGQRFDDHRRQVARSRGEGLTTLQRRLDDPRQVDADLVVWRELQAALDAAVGRGLGCGGELDFARPESHEAAVAQLTELNQAAGQPWVLCDP